MLRPARQEDQDVLFPSALARVTMYLAFSDQAAGREGSAHVGQPRPGGKDRGLPGTRSRTSELAAGWHMIVGKPRNLQGGRALKYEYEFKSQLRLAGWTMHLIPAVRRERQAGLREFEASLIYTESSRPNRDT